MGETLTELVEWMSALSPMWVYVSILGIAFLENVIPPIPGDMIVVFGGYMAGLGVVDPFLVILLSTIGGTGGFMAMYAMGHRLGHAVLDPDRFRWIPKDRIHTARNSLRHWGFRMVAANRFLSGLRSVISLTVGMSHMHPGWTLLWSSVSALFWTALLTILGIVVGENWETVSGYLQTYGWIIMGGLLLFATYHVTRFILGRKKVENESGDAG